jgi:hypothetical protein
MVGAAITRASNGRRAAAVLAVAVTLTACGAAGAAQQHSSSEPPLGYRSAPAFLPSTTAPVDRVVTATRSSPALAVQGIGVRVKLPAGQTLATVTGPTVPPFVTPPPPAVTATFTVTLAHGVGAVPVRLRDFTITDQLGRTFRPTLITHEKPPPAVLTSGRSATFRVTAVMPTGEGRLHWAPAGEKPVVSWDFIVEND